MTALEICKRKSSFKMTSLAAVAGLLLFLTPGPAFAVDNSDGPTVDADSLCEAANVMCQNACDFAKYTSTQRAACGANCQSSYERCVKSAAMRGTATESVGEVGTGGVSKGETVKKKKKRKTGIKQ